MSREPHVGHLTLTDLMTAQRELAAAIALARQDAPAATVAAVQLGAVEAELAARGETSKTGIRLCSCGFGSDGCLRFEAHLTNNPDHSESPQP